MKRTINKALEEQAVKAKFIGTAFGLDVALESSDEFSYNIEFSNGVTLYMTQMNLDTSVYYTVGYWDENVSFIPEFSDGSELDTAMEQVISLPHLWDTHKKMKLVLEDLAKRIKGGK